MVCAIETRIALLQNQGGQVACWYHSSQWHKPGMSTAGCLQKTGKDCNLVGMLIQLVLWEDLYITQWILENITSPLGHINWFLIPARV